MSTDVLLDRPRKIHSRGRAARISFAPRMKKLCLVLVALCLLGCAVTCASSVRVYPAPAGEELSKDYSVKVEGKDVPVYIARVAPVAPELRWKAMDDKARSAEF